MAGLKILVPTDLSPISQRALQYAAMLSAHIEADITVFHLVNKEKYRSLSEYQRDLAEIIEKEMRKGLKDATVYNKNLKKIKFEVKAKEEKIYQHITEFAKQGSFDLIIMGSHGSVENPDWEDRFMGTNAYQVVHHSHCRVITFINTPEPLRIAKILVPLDLTPGTIQKIAPTAELAKAFSATVYLLSVHPDPEDHKWAMLRTQMKSIARQLEEGGIKVKTKILQGDDFPQIILDYVKKKEIDLLSIMTRPVLQWNEILITPGAKTIITYATTPVLSVRPKETKDAIGL